LASEPTPESTSTPTFPTPPPEGRLSRIFLGDEGLRIGWRLLLFATFWLMIKFAIEILVFQIIGVGIDPYLPQYLGLGELIDFASAYAAALLMARIERRSASVYGLPLRQALGLRFWQGILLGLGEVSLLVGLIAALGGYSFGALAVHGADALRWGALWAVAFLFVGLSEEFLFRGYAQYTLARGIRFWPAAVTLSLVFGAAHWRNPGEGVTGVANVAVTGLLFAFALRRTGNLWLAVGWHASFDFGETFLFSVPNSGLVFDHHLSNSVLHGATWLTGGAAGPEGSVFSFVTMGLSALLIHYLFPAKKETASPA
jgi:uncharacterized protein